MKTTTTKEASTMAESQAKRDWRRDNTTVIKARLNHRTDSDIIEYLDGKSQANEIKRALRILIALENQKPLP
jgi:hypothetical protein